MGGWVGTFLISLGRYYRRIKYFHAYLCSVKGRACCLILPSKDSQVFLGYDATWSGRAPGLTYKALLTWSLPLLPVPHRPLLRYMIESRISWLEICLGPSGKVWVKRWWTPVPSILFWQELSFPGTHTLLHTHILSGPSLPSLCLLMAHTVSHPDTVTKWQFQFKSLAL